MSSSWHTLKEEIFRGTYIPSPVRRVEIPKPNGGVRKLGIPTVLDRFLQQAIAQVLTQVYDKTFSFHSYSFRPNKRGHDAVRQAWKRINAKSANLTKLGVNKWKAWEWANSRKGYWRIVSSPIIHSTLNNKYWQRLGLRSLSNLYQTMR